MKCTILHESRGRLRVHVCNVRMTLHRADVLDAYLNHHDAVSKAKVYERTGDVVVYYTGTRKDAVAALSTYRFDDPELDALVRFRWFQAAVQQRRQEGLHPDHRCCPAHEGLHHGDRQQGPGAGR